MAAHSSRLRNHRWLVLFAALLLILPEAVTARGADAADTVVVHAGKEVPTYGAFGRVQPLSVLDVDAGETGNVTGIRFRPGDHVQAGQKLTALDGPAIDSLIKQTKARVVRAAEALDVARKLAGIQKQQMTVRLSTRQKILEAADSVAQARARLIAAKADLNSAQRLANVTSPVDGTVLSLDTSAGARVEAGQVLFRIQPVHSLWVVAAFYGSNVRQLKPGMKGKFVPADGGTETPVVLSSIFHTVNPDGSVSVGLTVVGDNPGWMNGEAGKVVLTGASRKVVEVPTSSLILNQGRWWVVLRTAHGESAQPVVPGPARGWNTVVESGLAPGDRVVVRNAYLEFHHNIARSYQPPD